MSKKKPLTITDFWAVKKQIDAEVTRLGWSTATCIAYIQKHYGKPTRLVMTDEQLLHLLDTLKAKQSKNLTQNLLTNKLKRKGRKRF